MQKASKGTIELQFISRPRLPHNSSRFPGKRYARSVCPSNGAWRHAQLARTGSLSSAGCSRADGSHVVSLPCSRDATNVELLAKTAETARGAVAVAVYLFESCSVAARAPALSERGHGWLPLESSESHSHPEGSHQEWKRVNPIQPDSVFVAAREESGELERRPELI